MSKPAQPARSEAKPSEAHKVASNSRISAEPIDVAIVGYGPVGQLLAILLGQRGHRVHVVERWSDPYPLPRAVHFDHEVGRILQLAGVADALTGRTVPAPTYEWRNAAGETLVCFGRASSRSLSAWPESNMVRQPELEQILDARVRTLPSVTVERSAEATALSIEPERVAIAVQRAGGAPRELCARYAVGCDGANSRMRDWIGSGWHDLGFHFDWLVVDVEPADANWPGPLNWQLCDPARPTTLVSGGPGRRRWEFMRLPHETQDELNSEDAAWRLLARWGVTPANAKLERHAVYTFRARWADRWRAGRALIAGDAAHQMPPFAGQGMCAGLRDAANLAWKLDLVLRGAAREPLLDSYASERGPHVAAMIDASVALGRIICVADPEEAAERDRSMVAEARERREPIAAPLPPLGAGCLASGDPAAGALFVQDFVRRGGVSGRFDDVVGRGFALVSTAGDPADALDAESARFFAALGGITAHVAAGAPIEDLRGGYARWFAQHGAALALVRPDFAVFGVARSLDGAPALVAALRERL
jgi:2-polyprenyl-6-methoxyphenol hydroxylase-like FAD-dependent oxidoreductase